MDLQIEFYKEAFSPRGNGFNILVFIGVSWYQYGQVLNDGIVRFIPRVAQFFKPVAIMGV